MTEEPKKEKMVVPKVFDACPVCQSKVRLGAGWIQQLKDEGLIHKDSFNGGLMHQIPLLDEKHPPSIIAQTFKIPVILIYWDVCECGNMYCTKFDVVNAPAQVQTQQRPASNAFPINLRGSGGGFLKRN
jgi:hypothetical protein